MCQIKVKLTLLNCVSDAAPDNFGERKTQVHSNVAYYDVCKSQELSRCVNIRCDVFAGNAIGPRGLQAIIEAIKYQNTVLKVLDLSGEFMPFYKCMLALWTFNLSRTGHQQMSVSVMSCVQKSGLVSGCASASPTSTFPYIGQEGSFSTERPTC